MKPLKLERPDTNVLPARPIHGPADAHAVARMRVRPLVRGQPVSAQDIIFIQRP